MPPPASRQFSGIFINYRRDDSAGHAGRICDRLGEHFGDDQIFMDVDHIEPGQDFVEVLEKAVDSCEILLTVIGKHWLLGAGRTTRRLDNPNDFVRLEVAAALRRNIRVIPVLVQGAVMPPPEELPEDLVPLSRRQAIELRDQHWKTDIQRLINYLEKVLAEREAARLRAAQEEEAERQRLAAEEEQRRREEDRSRLEAEERLKAEEAEERRKAEVAEKERQREAEEAREREAEKERQRKAEEVREAEARRQATELEREQREAKEAERQRREAAEAVRRQREEAAAEEERLRLEEEEKRKDKEAAALAAEVQKRREDRERRERETAEAERLRKEKERQKAERPTDEPKPPDTTPAEMFTAAASASGSESNRVVWIALGALVAIGVIVAVWSAGSQGGPRQQSANQIAAATNTQPLAQALNTPLTAAATPSPTPEAIPTPDKAAFEKSMAAVIKQDKDMKFVIDSWKTEELRDHRKFKYGDLDGDGAEDAAVWFCGHNEGVGQNYWCKLMVYRNVKGVLEYAAAETWNLTAWASSDLRLITRDGTIIVADEAREVGDMSSPITKSQTKFKLIGNKLRKVR